MTEEELAAIEARADAATMGPWVVSEWRLEINDLGRQEFPEGLDHRPEYEVITGWIHGQAHSPIPIVWNTFGPYQEPQHFCHWDKDDAEFVAHAREDVPALIAEVRQLRATLQIFTSGRRRE